MSLQQVAPITLPRGRAPAAGRPRRRALPGALPAADSRTFLAASGFAMLAFVALHLGSNLLAFAGAETFNGYARALRQAGTPLVGNGVALLAGRVALAAALVAHLAAHLRLSRPGAPAPEAVGMSIALPGYAAYPLPVLRASGAALLLFLAFHLAQLTLGLGQPAFDPADAYHNLVTALGSWPVALAYLAAGAALGAHLLPGVWTGVRSLGLIRPGSAGAARVLAPAVALCAALGAAAAPLAALLGWLG